MTPVIVLNELRRKIVSCNANKTHIVPSGVMVELNALTKSYGRIKALDGVSFSVEKGSCFGLLGPNGAGKSTTISAIVGAIKPDGGTIAFNGKPPTPAARRNLGYVPQEIAIFEDLNAQQNLAFFGALYDLNGSKLKSRIQAVLTQVGLQDRANEPIKNFSGGMKRRLNIGVAFLHDPDLIIFDEPTVGVDPQSRNAIFDILEALKSQGKTLIYTTHYMEEAERLCDRIAIIDHGRVIAEGTLDDLLATLPARYRLTIRFQDAEVSTKAKEALARAEIGQVAEMGDRLQIVPTHVATSITGAITCLQRNQIPFEDFHTIRATLEEVFLNQTGRSLRD